MNKVIKPNALEADSRSGNEGIFRLPWNRTVSILFTTAKR
jgi:hypothetical protein